MQEWMRSGAGCGCSTEKHLHDFFWLSPAAGKGSVSAGRRIGVSASGGSKTAFRHGYNDQEVSTELMMLCKRRHADTPIRRYVSLSRPIFNATLRAAAGWLFFRPAAAHARQHKGRVQGLRLE